MTKPIYKGRIITLYNKKVALPNGRKTNLDLIHHPGAAAIVPILDDGRIVLIRQFRFASGGYLYEIPAGTLNKNESPLACAKRELVEETGFSARKFKRIASILTTPGFTDEMIHIYIAKNLKPAKINHDFDEVIENRIFTKTQIKKMIKKGEIRDGKTIAGLLIALAI